jgi:hypothetical protein
MEREFIDAAKRGDEKYISDYREKVSRKTLKNALSAIKTARRSFNDPTANYKQHEERLNVIESMIEGQLS